MKIAYLISTVLLVTAVSADRSLLAASIDKYGIVGGVCSGNGSSAVTGFVKAGQAADTTGVVTALVQVFSNGTYGTSGAQNCRSLFWFNLLCACEDAAPACTTFQAACDLSTSEYICLSTCCQSSVCPSSLFQTR